MVEYICKICVSYNTFSKLQKTDIITNLEKNYIGLVVHISKENYEKLVDSEKKNLEQYEVAYSPLPKQRKIEALFDVYEKDLKNADENVKDKMYLTNLTEARNTKQKYYIPKIIGKVNTKKKGGR